MDSQQFHEGVVALFKGALARWDWDKNPLEWEGLPNDMEAFVRRFIADALKLGEYGGPVRVCSDARRESAEALVSVQIPVFEDGDFEGYDELLSDALIRDCALSDEGWLLARHIKAIRKSLDEAERKAVALGWDLSE